MTPQSGNSQASELPDSIGGYRILSELGRGGMGVVYAAEQDSPRRRVALKVLGNALHSDELRRRFEAEASVLGRLQHPAIAKIYEARTFELAGVGTLPFFAMELVEGSRELVEYANEEQLDVHARIELFVEVVEAVEYGHQEGILHRDLKPANVLVGKRGRPKIIDFGIARSLDADEALQSLQTQTGQILGTPQYMSPEQYVADRDGIDARADVYSLGVCLFELLSGELPFAFETKPILEMARMVREDQPRRLSSVNRALGGDLEAVVGKALERDLARRYSSAGELAADLRRFLGKQPVLARPPSSFYQLRLFTRRNRALVSAISAVLLISIAAAIVSVRYAIHAEAERLAGLRETYRWGLSSVSAALDDGAILKAKRLLAEMPFELRGWEWRYFQARLDTTQVTLPPVDAAGPAHHALAVSLDDEVLYLDRLGVVSSWNTRGWQERPRLELSSGAGSLQIEAPGDGSLLLRGGKQPLVVGGDWTSAISRVDGTSGELLSSFEDQQASQEHATFTVRGGGRVATASRDRLKVYDLQGMLLAERALPPSQRRQLAFSGSGEELAVASSGLEAPVTIFATGTLELLASLPGGPHSCFGLTFDATGTRLALGSAGKVLVWDLEQPGAAALEVPVTVGSGRASTVLFDASGTALFVADINGSEVECLGLDGRQRGSLRTPSTGADFAWGGYARLALQLLSGDRLAGVLPDGSLSVWDLEVLSEPTILRGHKSFLTSLSLSPDGARLYSGGFDGWEGAGSLPGSLRVWDTETGDEVASFSQVGVTRLGSQLGDGEFLVRGLNSGRDSLRVQVLSTRSGHVLEDLAGLDPVALDGPRRRLIYGALDRVEAKVFRRGLVMHELDSGVERSLDVGFPTISRYSPGGRWFACSGGGHQDFPSTLQVFDADSLEEVAHFDLEKLTTSLDFAKGSALLAAASGSQVVIIDLEELAVKHVIDAGGVGQMVARFSPDGKRLALGGSDGVIQLLDTETWQSVAELPGHTSYVIDLAWSPDGERFYSGSGDGTIRIWETVPVRSRLSAKRERARLATELTPRVKALLDTGLSAAEVHADLAADTSLTARGLEVACQVALSEALETGD